MINLNTDIQNLIKKHLEIMSNLSVYDPESLLQKSKMMIQLQQIENNVSRTYQLIKDGITSQKQSLEKYMREAEASFNAVRQNIYNTNVDKQQKNVQLPNWLKAAKGGNPKPVSKETPLLVRREVAPDLFIRSYTIYNINECHKYPGWWCYYPDIDRFCTSLNGEILVGNTTRIRSASETPKKFAEDRRSEVVDWERSDYYVPRERNPNSRDKREFSNKMKFVPASQTPKKYETYCYRLGSRDTLKDDVVSLKPEDYRLFTDLSCNFLLSWTAAADEMHRRSNSGMQ